MAIELTVEEQANQVIAAEQHVRNLELENIRTAVQADSLKKSHRLELLRHAKDVLVENKRNAPVSDRVVTDEEIVEYATTLEKYINS